MIEAADCSINKVSAFIGYNKHSASYCIWKSIISVLWDEDLTALSKT